ncbi:hypothetical protein Bca52824_020408 [Brassica carinata]|uniref:ABC1 atypical kinase-like domain-containing protein n=1 Tax=Brassica carinata TaxID=52824 RepID=A0A8X7VTH3_BRACI|nr:hypothetical protein Bca52824_020408 [Brassica carinata]
MRPDILSPAAMTELQKLCGKQWLLFEEEIGKPWQEIYSELSPSPIAAASLGQVYKGRLEENGDLVAVKVQRFFCNHGLVTKLPDDQKYGMIEAIKNLINRDYDVIVKNFVKLGFIPDGVNLAPILHVLAKVLDQALEVMTGLLKRGAAFSHHNVSHKAKEDPEYLIPRRSISLHSPKYPSGIANGSCKAWDLLLEPSLFDLALLNHEEDVELVESAGLEGGVSNSSAGSISSNFVKVTSTSIVGTIGIATTILTKHFQ